MATRAAQLRHQRPAEVSPGLGFANSYDGKLLRIQDA